MTQDEKVDEASLESMDGSDRPARSAPRSGGPKRPEDMAGTPDEDAIRRHGKWIGRLANPESPGAE